jgi:uncharacterized protein YndB with AHSA1/START domain
MNQDEKDTIDAVRRELRDVEHEGRPARALVIERTYDTTADDVWDAVTNAERIPRWLLPIEGDLQLGGKYQLEGNAGGEILTCDAPRHLAVTWEFGGTVSWVDVHLTDEPDGGTRLRMEHVALLADLAMFGDQLGPGAVGIGWDLSLLGLTYHLRTGESVPGTAGAIPNPDFMARSSDAWCAADIASGTPEEKARAGAAAVLAMYTGGGGEDHHGQGGEGGEGGGGPAAG